MCHLYRMNLSSRIIVFIIKEYKKKDINKLIYCAI